MIPLPHRFLIVAVACAVTGMAAGITMAARHDFTLMPAHAHLNLLGWTTMALFGLYYRGDPEAAASRLAEAQFWCASIGVVLMIGSLTVLLLGSPAAEPLVAMGSILVLVSMLLFGGVVLRGARRLKPEALMPRQGTILTGV
jgi:hypothetical protein